MTNQREFPAHEKHVLKFACGHALDVRCGAGRHSVYLQSQGLRVTAIDLSPDIVSLAQVWLVQAAESAKTCDELKEQ